MEFKSNTETAIKMSASGRQRSYVLRLPLVTLFVLMPFLPQCDCGANSKYGELVVCISKIKRNGGKHGLDITLSCFELKRKMQRIPTETGRSVNIEMLLTRRYV